MAKIPCYSLRALEIWERLHDGRKPEAIQMVLADLQSGCADEDVQGIAAYLLDPPIRKRGAPKQAGPKRWPEIGAAFDNALDSRTWEVAREEVAAEFGVSEKHAENCLSAYRRARE